MTAIIELPPDGQLGPAMRSLASDQQRRFVTALLTLGDSNFVRAAMLAGYSAPDRDLLELGAQRLAHDPRVQAAIAEEAKRRLSAGMIAAVSTVLTVLTTAPKNSDRLKAAEIILNRTGLGEASSQTVHHVHHGESDKGALERIKMLALKLGVDPIKLLGNAGVLIEGEAVEVDEW